MSLTSAPPCSIDQVVVARLVARPDLHRVDALQRGFFSQVGHLVAAVLRERRVVRLDRLHDRCHRALRVTGEDVVEALPVLLDAEVDSGGGGRDDGVLGGLEVCGNRPDAVQVLVLLQVVEVVTLLDGVRLRVLVLRGAVRTESGGDVGDRRARLGGVERGARHVGDADRFTGLVLACDHVVDVVQEQRLAADHGEVVRTRLDDGVAGLVGVQLGVDEVDDDLSPRDRHRSC